MKKLIAYLCIVVMCGNAMCETMDSGIKLHQHHTMQSQSQSQPQKHNAKLIIGIILAVAGTIVAVDGLSKVDNSKPSLKTENWTWSKQQAGTGYPWYVSSNGIVENTGNVTLKYIKIEQTYYNSSGQVIGTGYCYTNTHTFDGLQKGALSVLVWVI